MCKFGLRSNACALAIKIGDGAFHVDGGPVITKEEMHAPGGICITVRDAVVSGEVKHGRFVASLFEMKPFQGD